MDLGQGFDLDRTEAAGRFYFSTTSVTQCSEHPRRIEPLSLPLIGVDHELVEVGVVLDDALGNHLDDVLLAVLQLVQFQVDSEQILPHSV